MALTKITVATAKTYFERYKNSTLSNVSDALYLDWLNSINRDMYSYLYNINPNDYISERLIGTLDGVRSYKLPTDFENNKVQNTGLYKTQAGETYYVIAYDTETGTFQVGETVTGADSGATATISVVQDEGTEGYLVVTSPSDDFEADEVITDSDTGVAVVVDYYKLGVSQDRILEGDFNSSRTSYYLSGDDIYIRPIPTTPNIYLFRYIPFIDDLDDDADTMVLDLRFSNALKDAMNIYFNEYIVDGSSESNADLRYSRSLDKLKSVVRRGSNVIRI